MLHQQVTNQRYFLVKTDPSEYSIEDFARDKCTTWDGVHNFQALQILRQWQIGDLVLVYHSQTDTCLVGLAQVISLPRPNVNDPRPSWVADLELVQVFPESQRISLQQIKQSGLFTDFSLIKQPRLSVMECSLEFIQWLRDQGLSL